MRVQKVHNGPSPSVPVKSPVLFARIILNLPLSFAGAPTSCTRRSPCASFLGSTSWALLLSCSSTRWSVCSGSCSPRRRRPTARPSHRAPWTERCTPSRRSTIQRRIKRRSASSWSTGESEQLLGRDRSGLDALATTNMPGSIFVQGVCCPLWRGSARERAISQPDRCLPTS